MSPPGTASKSKSRIRTWRTVRACAVVLVLVGTGCAVFQRRMIYFPPKLTAEQADDLARASNLERWKNATGENIGLKRLSPQQPAAGQVLIVYGNGGCAAWCAHYVNVIQSVGDYDVYVLEYPGYADRPGKVTERNLETAADEAFEALPTNHPVYVLGESLGTGVACQLAGSHPGRVAGVILLAPYNNLIDVAQYHLPVLPARLLLVDRFRSDRRLRTYHGPVAILVGGEDKVVPMKFGVRLYDGYSGPKQLLRFPDDNHRTVMQQQPEIWGQIMDFLKDHRTSNRQ